MVIMKIKKNTVNVLVLLVGTLKNEPKIRENIQLRKSNHDSNILPMKTSTKYTNNPTHKQVHSFIHSLVFSLRGRVGRNQSPVM